MSDPTAQEDFARACLESALAFAARGVRVFPIHAAVREGDAWVCTCKRPKCERLAKHPRTKQGFLDASTDGDKIRGWWKRWPESNVGLATGGNFYVLDVDVKKGGDESLNALLLEHGALPATYTVLTGGGGQHYFFAKGEEIPNSSELLGPGLDIRGDGGYVVAPPSRHGSGGQYLQELSSPETFAPGPEWLKRLSTKKRVSGRTEDWERTSEANMFTAGARNSALTSIAGTMRKRGVSGDTIYVALATENQKRCDPPLDEREVRRIAESVAKYSPDNPVLGTIVRDGNSSEGDWRTKLAYNNRDNLVPEGFNAALILRHADEWRDVLAYDEFTEKICWLKTAPGFGDVGAAAEHDEWSPREGSRFSDEDILFIQHWLQKRYQVKFNASVLFMAVQSAAKMRAYHPVREYLEAVKPTWDEKDRLSTWLIDYFAVEDTPYARAVGRGFLIQAVARVMDPGCQADYVLVLEGHQGKKKSTAMRALFGSDWFLENMPSLNDLREAGQLLPGHWGVEIPELDAMKGAAETRIKAFVTSKVDELRRSYARFAVKQPRQCVFVGTTNEFEWASDPTGGRRWWPVRVNGEIDIPGVVAARDQLWAQARVAHDAGEERWPAKHMENVFLAEQEKRYHVDEWEERIGVWLQLRKEPGACRMSHVFEQALHIHPERIDRKVQQRVGAIMARLGYVRRRLMCGGIRESYYVKAGTKWETVEGDEFAFMEDRYGEQQGRAAGGYGGGQWGARGPGHA